MTKNTEIVELSDAELEQAQGAGLGTIALGTKTGKQSLLPEGDVGATSGIIVVDEQGVQIESPGDTG